MILHYNHSIKTHSTTTFGSSSGVLVYLWVLISSIASVHAAPTISIEGDNNSITPSDRPVTLTFTEAVTTSKFVWRVAIVKKGETLCRSNICDNCWKRVCGSKLCHQKPASGTVLFNPKDIGGPGEYQAYLTEHEFKRRTGPLSFTVSGPAPPPTTAPTYTPTSYYLRSSKAPTTVAPTNLPTITPKPTACNVEDEISRIVIENNGSPSLSRRFSTPPQFKTPPPPAKVSLDQSANYDDYGCFYHDAEEDKDMFISAQIFDEGDSYDDKAGKCNEYCDTKHFAITESECFCYVKAPTKRLTIQGCTSIPGTCLDEDKFMDAFLKGVSSEECNQDNSSTVRNFLVEEDDAPFGYDITANSFRLSPFELEKDACGTNIYEVQTEVSEGTNILSTNSKVVSEFAGERRKHISGSVSVSASASGWLPFIGKGGAEVMASMDTEVNTLMKYSGSSNIASKVFTSFGVKRLAEVKLVDFDNRFNFVTFNSQFANLLRRYRDNDYSLEVAKEIFEKYGMFVVERGIFGGYRQLRSTVDSRDIENFSSSERDFKLCFELAMSVNAKKLFGLVKGEASTEIAGCTADVQKQMNRRQEEFSQEVSNEVVGGGKIVDLAMGGKSFVVSPEDSILLTDVDKYPEGDDGIKLRILSDFLLPDKVSPLEAKRHLITERQFEEIRMNLDAHIVEVLQDQLDSLDECPQSNECTVPYLEENHRNATLYQCSCYTPKEPEPLDICSEDGLFQPEEHKFYTIQRDNKDGDYWKEQDSLVLSAPGGNDDARVHWKFQKTGVSNNWYLLNGYSGKHIASLDDEHRLKIASSRKEVKVTCQDDGTIRIYDANPNRSRYAATVLTKSKSSECRYPTFLDSCKDYFGTTFERQTAYKDCGSLDLKRYKVCSQYSITFPLKGTFKKTTHCAFPNFLGSCRDNFGNGWVQEGTRKCGLRKIRRNCKFSTTDKSSSFFVSPVVN